MRLGQEKEKFKILGPPGDETDLVKIKVPKFKLSFMKDYYVDAIRCNKIVAPALSKIYQEIMALAPEVINDSGILIFGGCYEFRATRGSQKRERPLWSAHAWGIAVDHDPNKNGLYWKKDRANFPKYPEIIKIFNKYGFLNFGQAPDRNGIPYNRDWMHFEASYEYLINPEKFIKQ